MIAWLLVGCVHRVTLVDLSDRPIALSAPIPATGGPTAGADVRVAPVKGTGADRDSNEWLDVAPGVRVQCELYHRKAAVALFVDPGARPGTWETTCPLGGVNLRLQVEATR